MPAAQAEEGIRAHQAKESAIRRQLGAQVEQRLQRDSWARRRGLGASASEIANPGSPAMARRVMASAVIKAGGRAMRLERLRADRGKEHSIQPERRAGSARHGQMAQVRRVETSAKKRYAPAAAEVCSIWSIVPCCGMEHMPPARASGSIKFTMRLCNCSSGPGRRGGFRAGLAGSLLHTIRALLHQRQVGLRHREPQPVLPKSMHIPVAAIGIAGYLAMAGLALARRRRSCGRAGAGRAGFLALSHHIEKYVLEVWCLYCVISQGIIVLITAAQPVVGVQGSAGRAAGVKPCSRLSSTPRLSPLTAPVRFSR